MQATQKQRIAPNEGAELTTSSSEHSRDGKAVEYPGGSTPEGQAQKSLPFLASNDGPYGEASPNLMSHRDPQEEGPLAGDVSQQHPLDQVCEAFERRYRRLGEIVFDNSAWRMELCHRLDNLEQHLNRFQTSFESFMETPSKPAGSNTSPKKPRARRKKMHPVKLDFDALKDQVHALNNLTAQLRENDRKQEAAEGSFNNAVEAIITILRRRGLISNEEKAVEVFLAPTLASTSEHSSDIASPIAVELAAYYDAVSTLRNMAERIGELQVEQQEQLERRGVMEDQGQILEQNEDDFDRMWQDLFDVAYNNFKAAQTAVQEKRQECVAMNIAIPAWAEVDSAGEKIESLNNDAPDHDIASPPYNIPANSQLQTLEDFPLALNEPLLQSLGSPLPTPPQQSIAKESIFRWIENTDPGIDSQPQDFPESIPLPPSRGVTPEMEQQDDAFPMTLPLRTHDRNDTVAGAAQSDDATATTLPYDMASGGAPVTPRASSLGAERGLEVDHEVWKLPWLETTSLP